MTRMEFYGSLNKYKDANLLSHKQSPLYGQQRPNAKYYRREGEPGNYRYFRTKEEWDAYQNGNKTVSTTQFIKNPNGDPIGIKKTIATIANDDVKEAIEKEAKRQKIEKGKNKVLGGLTNSMWLINRDARRNYSQWENELENKYRARDEATQKEAEQYKPFYYDGCVVINWKDPEDIYEEIRKSYIPIWGELHDRQEAGEDISKEYIAKMDEYKKTVEDALEDELSKREASLKGYAEFNKAYKNKLDAINHEMRELSPYEKQAICDEMGIDDWSSESLIDGYGFDEESIYDCDDDYNAAKFEELTEQINEIWNDYKTAKKAIK